MKQIIIQKALSNIHSEKNKHQEEYVRKMHALFADKNYEKLDKELTKTVIENARKQANNLPPDIKKEKELQQKIETLKKQYHLENVQMEYSCPLCKDAGYIDGQMCKCLKKEVSNLLLKESGFENLEDFSQAIKTSGKLEECFSLMKKWCHSDFKRNLIYISGPTGVGKTHLVKCMAKELIERGKFVKIVTAFAMNHMPIKTDCLSEINQFLGEVPVVPYGTPGTSRIYEHFAEIISDRFALLLANHGLVTFAPDLEHAFSFAEAVEKVAQQIVISRLLGTPVPIDEAEIQFFKAYSEKARQSVIAAATGA